MQDGEKIYVGQTALTIKVKTKIDLTEGNTILIKYKKPSGAVGSFTALIESPATNGIIYYSIQTSDDLDESGTWTMWAHITFNDTKSAPGKPFHIFVYPEGEA